MNEYDELMGRHQKLMDDWMRRVKGHSGEFVGHGIRLLKDGSLEMWARHPATGQPLWVLSMAPGDEQVRITFPDKTTYLV